MKQLLRIHNKRGETLLYEVEFTESGKFIVNPLEYDGATLPSGHSYGWSLSTLLTPPGSSWQQTYTAPANPAAAYGVNLPDGLTMYPLTPTAKKHAAPVHRCSWVTYTGFIETFEYCSDPKCGKRKVPVGS